MQNRFYFSEIIASIKKIEEHCKFHFDIEAHLQKEMQFASLKDIVSNGLYYLDDATAVDKFAIETGSIIITDKKIETKHLLITHHNPQLLYYKIVKSFEKPSSAIIEKSAVLSPDTKLGKNVSIGHFCVLGDCSIGDNVVIKNNVVIEDNVIIGDNTFIDSNSVIGAAGLAWIWDENGKRIILPQLGGVRIGSDCILATDITVVRGSLSENTSIGNFTVIAHGTKIGHGSQIGSNVHMANNVSLAGNAVVGDRSFLGSACIIAPSIKLPNNSILGAGAMLNKNYNEEYCTFAGIPAKILKNNNFQIKPSGAPKPFKNK